MSKLLQRILFVVAACHIAIGHGAVTPNRWESPDSKYELTYRQINTILGSSSINSTPSPYLFLLKENEEVKWIGQVNVDESANNSSAIWSPNSQSSLLLVRPNRGSCYAYLLTPKSQNIIFDFHVDAIIKDCLTKSKDDDWHNLVKAWFGPWKWISDNIATGTIHITKAHAYTANLKIVADTLKIEVISFQQETEQGAAANP